MDSEKQRNEHSGSSDCSSALDVLRRLRDWTIGERDTFAEQAKSLDRHEMHFEADQKWQRYWAFNTVCLWAEEEMRKICAKIHSADASTFTEHVQRQHDWVAIEPYKIRCEKCGELEQIPKGNPTPDHYFM